MMWMMLAIGLSLCQDIAEMDAWHGAGSLPAVDELKVDGRLQEWEKMPLVFFCTLPDEGRAALWLAGEEGGLCLGACLEPKQTLSKPLQLDLELHPFSGLTGLGAKEFSFVLEDPPSWTGPEGNREIQMDVAIMKREGFIGFESVLPWDALYPLVPLEVM